MNINMVKTVRLSLLALCLALALCACKQVSEPFFFVQITDPQMGFKEKGEIGRSVRLLTETVDAINRIQPPFVIVTGDMLNHWDSPVEAAAYDSLMARIDPGIKVYQIPGNHDFRPLKEEGKGSDTFYMDRYGYDRFVFTYGGCLFLGFNSCYVMDAMEEKEAEQYEWIVSNLDKYRGKVDRIFLFSHCPIIKTSPDEEADNFCFSSPYREKYLNLCKEFNVDAVFAGHFHRARSVRNDGTLHVTCTASGWPLGDGFSAINVVSVSPEGVSFDMVPPEEAVAPEL